MAIAKGQVSKESSSSFKRYIGVAPVFILAVNPDKAELEKLYNTTFDKVSTYVGEGEVGPDKKKVPQIRIDFIVKTDGKMVKDAEGNPVELLNRVTFFLRKAYRTNRDNTKLQVIDKYGRTAWVTQDEYKAHALPAYMNGEAFRFDKDYRPAYWGEPELVAFIKAYLCIKDPEKWENKQIVGLKDNPENFEIMFEHIDDWFKGNVQEIRDAVALQPKNEVRVLFGIKTTEDNKQYQAVYTQKFISMDAKKDSAYAALDKEVQERKNAGAYPSTEFEVCDLKEYVLSPTDFSSEDSGDMPDFGAASANPWA